MLKSCKVELDCGTPSMASFLFGIRVFGVWGLRYEFYLISWYSGAKGWLPSSVTVNQYMFKSDALIFTMAWSVIELVKSFENWCLQFVEDVLVLMNSNLTRNDERIQFIPSFKASSLNHNREKSKQNCFRVSFGGILSNPPKLSFNPHSHYFQL